jgi:hypothetical protein
MLCYDSSCNYASGTYRKSRVTRLSTDEAQLSTTKSDGMWEYQLTLAFAYYHFVVLHRGLRRRLPRSLPTKGRNGSRKKWQPVTPAHGSQTD